MPGNYPKEIMPIERNALVTYKTVTVANPAAGAEWSTTVTAAKIWEIIAITFKYATSAVAGNRYTRLVFTDGTNEIGRVPAALLQAENNTFIYTFGHGASAISVTGAVTMVGMPLFVLNASSVISTVTDSKGVADQFSAIAIYVKEIAIVS